MSESERNHEQFQETKREILNPEEFWAAQEPAIQEWALNTVQEDGDYNVDEKAELQKKLVESEKKFTLNIINEFNNLLANNKNGENPIILWDIDETMAKNVFIDEKSFDTVFRPSITELMKYLTHIAKSTGVILEQGLLTSRAELQKQLQESNRLAPIAEYVSPELLYSDRDAEVPYIPKEDEQIKFYSEKLSGILDSESIIDLVEGMYVDGDFTKLIKLSQIKSEKPNTPIMTIDDMSYPNILSRDKNMYGVSLRKEGYFSLP